MNNFDIVITWVDWSNKNFIKKMLEVGGRSEGCADGEFIEMKYLLRSLDKHKVNYKNIHIVYSDNHPPPKYLKETDRLFFVPHSKLVTDQSHLPLIHRESIVAHLHRIPNLYKYYYYFQDDLFVMNNIIFDIQINEFNNKKIHVYRKELKDKYNVTESCGLWNQSTVNSVIAIRGFNKDKIIIFEHSIQLFDKDIMFELEKLYPKHFLYTQTYKNQLTETYKEPYIICATCMFCNYLIYKKKFGELSFDDLKIYQIHTNTSIEIHLLANQLETSLNYWILNAQGNGISDEYPKSDKIHKIFYSFLETTFPNKTLYENDSYKNENFTDYTNDNFTIYKNKNYKIRTIFKLFFFVMILYLIYIVLKKYNVLKKYKLISKN